MKERLHGSGFRVQGSRLGKGSTRRWRVPFGGSPNGLLVLGFFLLMACSVLGADAVGDGRVEGMIDQADLFFRAGEYDKALPLYQQQLGAVSDAENGGRLLFHIGQCLTGMKQYKESAAAFGNAMVKFPASSWSDDALLRKGSIQAGLMHNPVYGLATWQELIKKYSKSDLVPEARFLMGMVDWINGQKSRAKDTWRILIHDFPKHARSAQAQQYLGGKS